MEFLAIDVSRGASGLVWASEGGTGATEEDGTVVFARWLAIAAAAAAREACSLAACHEGARVEGLAMDVVVCGRSMTTHGKSTGGSRVPAAPV